MKKLINLILLIAISFSIAHGVILDTHEDKHCSANEFVKEFSQPIQHDIEEHNGDLCNSHFMLHLPFLIPSSFFMVELNHKRFSTKFEPQLNPYIYINNTFRPPII